MLKKIAVTGSIATGKSTVCKMLQTLGAKYVDADQIVHTLYFRKDVIQNVVSLLGEDVVVDGSIDRALISKKIFKDRELLQKLEAYIHPKVFEAIDKVCQGLSDKTLVVIEIPLLFEIGKEDLFDASVLVTAPQKECLKRFKGTQSEYTERLDHFMDEKSKKAQFLIENSGSIDELKQKVQTLYGELQNL